MNRHVVNLGLCFSLSVMLITGGIAYWFPFSLLNARLHVFGGVVFAILIALHLVARIAYLRKMVSLRLHGLSKSRAIMVVGVMTTFILVGWIGAEPTTWLMNQSYEARHRREIVRASPLVGFGKPSSHSRLIYRKPDAPSSVSSERPSATAECVDLSVWLGFSPKMKTLPSIVVWAESMTGTMIETLFLEEELSYSETIEVKGARKRRGDLLPIWRHKYSLVSGTDPNGDVDVMSGATETHQFSLDGSLIKGQGNEFVLCVEVNLAGDPNEQWPDPILGQPSLLYTAVVEVDSENPNALLELTAHGGGAEADGNLQYDLSSVTSAKHLADLFVVKVSK